MYRCASSPAKLQVLAKNLLLQLQEVQARLREIEATRSVDLASTIATARELLEELHSQDLSESVVQQRASQLLYLLQVIVSLRQPCASNGADSARPEDCGGAPEGRSSPTGGGRHRGPAAAADYVDAGYVSRSGAVGLAFARSKAAATG
jgi:hypothetical protein